MSAIPDSLDRTATHWGEEAGTWTVGRGRNWFEVPAVQDRISRLITGRSDTDLYHWLMELVAKRGRSTPFGTVLTLGCGAGDLERGLYGIGFAHRYEGIDVAAQAIGRARAAAAALSGADITYEVADINTLALKADSYDAISCPMSAHHFSDLESVFGEVHRALKPGGFFFLNEYIGPKRFQWPAHQVALIDLLLRNLPECWVRTAEGGLRRGFAAPTVEEVVRVDPTEAVRSDEILPVLAQQFVITTYAPYGGSLLHGLLDHIGVNFVGDDPEAKAMLNTFFALEDWALRSGFLQHDFAAIVAQRARDVGGSPGIRDPNWGNHGPVLNQLEQQKQELASLQAQLTALRSSRSWRLTAPLRWLRRAIARSTA